MDISSFFISDINLTRWVIGTLVLFLLLGGFSLVLAKFKHDKSEGLPRRIKRLEILNLTPRHQLHLVQHNGTEHLILTGPQGDTVIANASERPTLDKPTVQE